MIKKADVIIIGGGIARASIAYYLAEKSDGKMSVALIERRNIAEGTIAKSLGAVYLQQDSQVEYYLSL